MSGISNNIMLVVWFSIHACALEAFSPEIYLLMCCTNVSCIEISLFVAVKYFTLSSISILKEYFSAQYLLSRCWSMQTCIVSTVSYSDTKVNSTWKWEDIWSFQSKIFHCASMTHRYVVMRFLSKVIGAPFNQVIAPVQLSSPRSLQSNFLQVSLRSTFLQILCLIFVLYHIINHQSKFYSLALTSINLIVIREMAGCHHWWHSWSPR